MIYSVVCPGLRSNVLVCVDCTIDYAVDINRTTLSTTKKTILFATGYITQQP